MLWAYPLLFKCHKVIRSTSLSNPWVKETFILLSCSGPKGVNKEHEWSTLEMAGPPSATGIWCMPPQCKGPIWLCVWSAEQGFANRIGRKPRTPGHPLWAFSVPYCQRSYATSKSPPGACNLLACFWRITDNGIQHDGTGSSYQRLINVSL